MIKLGITTSNIKLGTTQVLKRYLGATEVWSSYTWLAEATTLIAAMTTPPDDTRARLINDTISALKTNGIWDSLDDLWFFAAHNDQASLLGWKRIVSAIKLSLPFFEADRGVTGKILVVSGCIDTKLNLLTTTKFKQNSGMFCFYNRTTVTDTQYLAGSQTTISTERNVFRFNSIPTATWAINGGSTVFSTAVPAQLGLFALNRANTSASIYRQGVALGTVTTASYPPSNCNFYVLSANINGTGRTSPCPRQVAFSAVGESLDATKHAMLNTIVQNYMTAVGANV